MDISVVFPGFFPGNQAKYAQDVDGLSRSSLAQVGVAIETGISHGKWRFEWENHRKMEVYPLVNV